MRPPGGTNKGPARASPVGRPARRTRPPSVAPHPTEVAGRPRSSKSSPVQLTSTRPAGARIGPRQDHRRAYSVRAVLRRSRRPPHGPAATGPVGRLPPHPSPLQFTHPRRRFCPSSSAPAILAFRCEVPQMASGAEPIAASGLFGSRLRAARENGRPPSPWRPAGPRASRGAARGCPRPDASGGIDPEAPAGAVPGLTRDHRHHRNSTARRNSDSAIRLPAPAPPWYGSGTASSSSAGKVRAAPPW